MDFVGRHADTIERCAAVKQTIGGKDGNRLGKTMRPSGIKP
jgi:hypothetical protein